MLSAAALHRVTDSCRSLSFGTTTACGISAHKLCTKRRRRQITVTRLDRVIVIMTTSLLGDMRRFRALLSFQNTSVDLLWICQRPINANRCDSASDGAVHSSSSLKLRIDGRTRCFNWKDVLLRLTCTCHARRS